MLLLGSFASRLAKSDDWSTSASRGKRNSLLASASVGLCALMVLPPTPTQLKRQQLQDLQGSFAYLAIAPTRGVAAFFVMNEFSTGGFTAAVAATNGLIAQLAPR